MNRTSLAALGIGALFALAVQAQDPQKPAPQAEETKQEPAAKPAPGPGQEPDPKILEGIMGCLAEGLSDDWKKAWFVIREIGRDAKGLERKYEANFFFSTDANARKGRRLQTCGAERILEGVGALNDYLPENQKRWTGATISFYRDGRYEANYDYTPPKPAAKAKSAAKAAPKKTQESGK